MAARSQRTKLTFGDFGLPAGALSLAGPNENSVLMGTLGGIATDFTIRKSPDNAETYEGLSGSFRLIPSDPKREELESGVLFIPDAFHGMLATPLRKMRHGDPANNLAPDPNGSVEFLCEVYAIRAKNPVGYSWEMKPLGATAKNPLDALFEKLPQLKLASGKGAPKQVENKTK